MIKHIKKPLLMILAVLISLGMIRLGLWQLDRAEQKRVILKQSRSLASQQEIDLMNFLDDDWQELQRNWKELRFRQVTTNGHYLAGQSIFIDNQVVNSQVGYWLISPFQIAQTNKVIMVNQGWLPAGDSRETLPEFNIELSTQVLHGRLNKPTAKPPIWNDDYAVNNGVVWQYLPITKFATQSGLDVLPLVLELEVLELEELAPQTNELNSQAVVLPIRQFPNIKDNWVGKHKAYALQWFGMALVFFLACVIVLFQSFKPELKPKL